MRSVRRWSRFLEYAGGFVVEAGAAEYGAALRGAEGNGGFDAALRAVCACLGCTAAAGSIAAPALTGAFALAVFAALGIVRELFIVKKELLACGEHKIVATVLTLQTPVHKIHRTSPQLAERSQIREQSHLPVMAQNV